MPQPISEKESIFLSPLWNLDERFKLASMQSIKRTVYYPSTPYGLGRFIQINTSNEEVPIFKIGNSEALQLSSTNEIKEGVLKMKETITPTPNSFEDLLRDAITLWLSIKENSIQKLSEEIEISERKIIDFLNKKAYLSFNDGYDIECFLAEENL